MILVICPLQPELKALRAALDAAGARAGAPLECVQGGHGKTQFALHTLELVDRFKPEIVICAGAAGALSPEARAGDVVVSLATIEHDFHLRFVSRPQPEFSGDESIIDQLRGVSVWPDFNVHFGRIASGDEDVIDPSRARELRDRTGALAVAWEGAGGARASRLRGVRFVEIRAITDLCDASSPEEFQNHLRQAMSNLAKVLVRISI